jgi:two-component system sensor histidine kinase BaeS
LISGDTERLHQLFANLLGNSLKYTDIGGELKIFMAVDLQKVIINFMDSAPGVAPEELERLFERLYRVEASRNRSSGGAGLGLSICKNIVDAHGGSIAAHPSELGGLLIRIELPMQGGA